MSKLIQQRRVLRSLALSMLCFTVSLPIARLGYPADDMTTTSSSGFGDAGDTLTDIKAYLYNLGTYLGYSLDSKVTTPTSNLLDSTSTDGPSIARNTFASFFGAMPVNASLLDAALMNFVPSAYTAYIALNTYANATFVGYNAQNASQGNTGTLSVSPLLDQQPYQQDPINQYILNILGTPDYTYCMGYEGTSWNETCKLLYQNKVMNNIIGTLPLTPYLDATAPLAILSELNSDSLTGPLLYATTTQSSTSSSTAPANATGLTATTQAQQAANFIRYASGAVVPLSLMSHADYMAQLGDATPPTDTNSTSYDRTKQEKAQAVLTKYLNQVRVYAAQQSVAISNLYYILSKRMPQTNGVDGNATSQAMSEMTMATRRIYNPAAVATDSPQWLAQINTASPASVQKEMAILLSEINYQLYLNRQQDERLLLTNSLLLIQTLTTYAPSPSN